MLSINKKKVIKKHLKCLSGKNVLVPKYSTQFSLSMFHVSQTEYF